MKRKKRKVQVQIDFELFTDEETPELELFIREGIIDTFKSSSADIVKFKESEVINVYTSSN